jgi:hypothetical protein
MKTKDKTKDKPKNSLMKGFLLLNSVALLAGHLVACSSQKKIAGEEDQVSQEARYALGSIKGAEPYHLTELQSQILRNLTDDEWLSVVRGGSSVDQDNFGSRNFEAFVHFVDGVWRSAADKNSNESRSGRFNFIERIDCLAGLDLDVDGGFIAHLGTANADYSKVLENKSGRLIEKAKLELSSKGSVNFQNCKLLDYAENDDRWVRDFWKTSYGIQAQIDNLEYERADLVGSLLDLQEEAGPEVEIEILEQEIRGIDSRMADARKDLAEALDFEILLEASLGDQIVNRRGLLEYEYSGSFDLSADYDLRESIFDMPGYVSSSKKILKSIENVKGVMKAYFAIKADVDVGVINPETDAVEAHRFFSDIKVAFAGSAFDVHDLLSLPTDPLFSSSIKKSKMKEILERTLTCSGSLRFGDEAPIACERILNGLIEESLDEATSEK